MCGVGGRWRKGVEPGEHEGHGRPGVRRQQGPQLLVVDEVVRGELPECHPPGGAGLRVQALVLLLLAQGQQRLLHQGPVPWLKVPGGEGAGGGEGEGEQENKQEREQGEGEE